MTRTGTLIFSRCAVWASVALWTSVALAQSASWQPTRSDGEPSRSHVPNRGAASPTRWLSPTHTSSKPKAPKSKTSAANKSVARRPNPFTPPADAKQLAPARKPVTKTQSAAVRKSSNKLPTQAAASQPQRRTSTSAAQMSQSAAHANGPAAKKSTSAAQRTPRPHSQANRSPSRPRASADSWLDDSWIRPLKQVAYQQGEPEELYAPPEHEMQMQGPGGPGGQEFQSEGEWIGSPDGAPYGGPCCDGQCGPDCECGPMCGEDCCEPSCGCGTPGCNGTDCCIDLGFGLHDPEACEEVRFRIPKAHTIMVNGGVHGFKGPYDRLRDGGNFGFQEGFNIGFKVPLSEFGYQIGYQTMQSQLSGDANTGIVDGFSQHFVTAGLFRRTCDGFQGGIAWDSLLDERDTSVDFSQLRAEIGFVDCGCHEIGVMAAVHLSDEWFLEVDNQTTTLTTFQATDQYLLYYRMHGKRGGEGRVYAGINDDSDGIVGADFLLPLTDCWSLQPEFTYLIPEEGGGAIGARQEAWNIAINLVWHWKGQARSCHSSPYRPLFNVANNGTMIIDDRP